jgi:glyoxylase-like metal-dependent hydrolase (beta-lactamase superfamily II)
MTSIIHPVRIPFKLPINESTTVDRVVFAYIIKGERLCLVDTGPAGGEQAIVAALADMGLSEKDIDLVVNTHEHPDHIGGNHYFHQIAGPDFACHADALRWIETLDVQAEERPIFRFYSLAGQAVNIQQSLQDGDVIDLGGGVELTVIFTPGHSPGSICLFCPQDGSLIIGDVVQPVDRLPLYTDLVQTRESLERLMTHPGVERMYMAWVEKPFSGKAIEEALNDSLEYLEEVDAVVKKVTAELPDGSAVEAITREVLIQLGLNPPPVLAMTVASVRAHLMR